MARRGWLVRGEWWVPALTALLAVGCGGSADPSSENTTPEAAGAAGDAGKAGAAGKGTAGGSQGGGAGQAQAGAAGQGGAQAAGAGGGAGNEPGGAGTAGSAGVGAGGSAGSEPGGSAGVAGSEPGGAAGEGGAGASGGCCKADTDCPSTDATAQVCVNGQCKTPAGQGMCWSDSDCSKGFFCSDEAVCPCGAQCDSADKLGACVALGDGCCKTDDECVMQGFDQCVQNVCRTALKAGQCWDVNDCGPNQHCQGAAPCPCGFDCFQDTPGLCVDAGNACCTTDDECAKLDPKRPACVSGVCDVAPGPGQCWDSADCGGGECSGAQVCPCGSDCLASNTPGTCVVPTGGCCKTDDECVKQGLAQCVNTVCMGKLEAGSCWDDGDCAKGSTCEGEFVCPCNAKCIQPTSPGKCTLPGALCCKADFECGKGFECVNNVCKALPAAGECWDDGDCGLGGVCQGETVCPCGAQCLVPDTAGQCASADPGSLCCKTDLECGKGFECVNNVCKALPAAGECWDDGDCGLGGVCQGENVCVCGAKCLAPDAPGKCASVAPGDACCKADLECGKGFECVNNVCKALPPAGECWDAGDCALGSSCQGASVCPCGAACFQADSVGKCVVGQEAKCCAKDVDCGVGAQCVTAGLLQQGVCKPLGGADGCWDDSDCKGGTTCQGEQVCPCGSQCFAPDAPGVCK